MATPLEIMEELDSRGILPPEKKTLFDEIKRRGLTDPTVISRPETEIPDLPIGALVGGTVGAAVGAAGGPVGAAAGAGLGAAGGEAVEQLGRRALGMEVPETSLEAARDIAVEGGLGLIGEAGGRIAIGGAAKVLSRFSKRVPVEAKDAINFIEENMPSTERGKFNPLRYVYGKNKAKLGLLPAEATDDRVLDIVHNVAESSIIGGQSIQDFKLNRAKFFQDYADDFIQSFGELADADDIGNLFIGTLDEKITPHRTLASSFYNVADDLTRGRVIQDPVTLRERTVDAAKISTRALKSFAEKQRPVIEAAKGIGGAESGDSLIRAVLAIDDEVSFTVAKNLRSRLRAAADGFSVVNKKAPAIGKAKRMGGMLDDSIETGLKAHKNPQALDAWRTGNRIYKQGIKDFDNVFLRRLVRNADPDVSGKFPETIVHGVFRKNNLGGIRIAKKAMGGLESTPWKKMQSWHAQDLLARGTGANGELSGSKLTEAMFGRTGMGEKAMREIYSPAQVESLKQFSNALKVAQERQAEGTGRMLIQLAQGGAVFQIATGVGGGAGRLGAATILLAPAVLARAMTNPRIAKIITDGVKAGTKSKVAAGALGRFITDVTNLETERQKQEAQ